MVTRSCFSHVRAWSSDDVSRPKCLLFARSVDLGIDFRDLLDPDLSLPVFHLKDLVRGPVKMVGDVSYLLVEPLQGVA